MWETYFSNCAPDRKYTSRDPVDYGVGDKVLKLLTSTSDMTPFKTSEALRPPRTAGVRSLSARSTAIARGPRRIFSNALQNGGSFLGDLGRTGSPINNPRAL